MIKELKDFEKGKDYFFNKDIDEFIGEENIEVDEHGHNIIGENFLVLKENELKIVSFILSGTTSNDYIYTCIYTDFT